MASCSAPSRRHGPSRPPRFRTLPPTLRRSWPYLPKIYNPAHVDELLYVSQEMAEDMCRRLAREEGIFGGISAAGACWVAQEIAKRESNATIVFIVCDRGDRYLSTGVFPA